MTEWADTLRASLPPKSHASPLSAHLAHIENKVITIRIAPIRAEHRHEPAAARLVDLFYIMARRHVSQTLPCPDLFDAKFDWRGQKYFQHMADTGQKLMTQVAVVNQLAVVSQFTQRSLKSDPVGPQVLQQTFPPVLAFLDDVVELC